MKKNIILLIIILLITFIRETTAQNEKTIEDFVNKIDNYLQELSESTSRIVMSKKINDRKISLSGKFDNGSKRFHQKIKYYKGGTKKETIIILNLETNQPVTLLEIVLINDEYFYIHKISYSPENKIAKIADEKLIDGKIYLRWDYDKRKKITNRINIWKMKTK